jgi:hypothetical protein
MLKSYYLKKKKKIKKKNKIKRKNLDSMYREPLGEDRRTWFDHMGDQVIYFNNYI